MKKAGRFLAVILIIGCLSRTHYAVKAQNIKVISGEGENRSVIYTGPKEGYPGGGLNSLEFDDMDFYVILNWDTDEILHIYPVDTQQTETQNSVIGFVHQTDSVNNLNNTNNTNNANTTTNSVEVTIDSFVNAQGYAAVFTIDNSGETQSDVKLFGALYTNGQLAEIVTETISVQGGSVRDEQIVLTEGVNQADTVKFFAWANDDIKPLCEAEIISPTTEDSENEIFENIPKQLMPGESYLFEPKRSGTYSFSDGENIILYRKVFSNLTEIDTDTILYYPEKYYIEVDEQAVVEIEYSDDRMDAFAFLSGEYLSDMSDSGSLYRGNNVVYSSLSRWLSKGDNLFFNSNGLKMLNENTNEAVSLLDGVNPYYIVADGNVVYFADWNNGGRICKYQDGQLSILCNDKASWLRVSGDYIYYKNLLDSGKEYRIEKNAENAPCGNLTE